LPNAQYVASIGELEQGSASYRNLRGGIPWQSWCISFCGACQDLFWVVFLLFRFLRLRQLPPCFDKKIIRAKGESRSDFLKQDESIFEADLRCSVVLERSHRLCQAAHGYWHLK
jgi:hypothetical protein